MAVISVVLLVIIVLSAVFAGFIAPYGETQIIPGAIFESPSGEYLFGTDSIGRDNFSRVLYGGRISLAVGVSVAVFSGIIGTVRRASCRATSADGWTRFSCGSPTPLFPCRR